MQVILVNKSISILVNHVEGLFELRDLSLVKHRKHVGSRSLGALLVRATAAGSLA